MRIMPHPKPLAWPTPRQRASLKKRVGSSTSNNPVKSTVLKRTRRPSTGFEKSFCR